MSQEREDAIQRTCDRPFPAQHPNQETDESAEYRASNDVGRIMSADEDTRERYEEAE